MQLLPVILVAIVMAVDGGLRPLGAAWQMSSAAVTGLAWGPVLVIVLAAMLGVSRCERLIRRGNLPGPLVAADRIVRWSGMLIVLNHAAAVLVFGWLGMVRKVTGDVILIDESIAMLPALLGLAGTWWAYYPVERRIRDALIIRRLDEGRPIYPTITRLRYVLLQARLHLLMLLVPLMIIIALGEMMQRIAESAGSSLPAWFEGVATFLAAAGVFVLSPLLARVLLDVEPLAPGPLRQMLQDICDRHRVRVRDLLLWKTNGTVINAAVMGLIGPLRFVMMTDALLENLREDQVRAVMAHEIAHVRRHHMPWMVVALMAAVTLAWLAVEGAAYGLQAIGWSLNGPAADGLEVGLSIAHLALGLLAFGWISRRFERQADTFAVQHLSAIQATEVQQSQGQAPTDTDTFSPASSSPYRSDVSPVSRHAAIITPAAVESMCGALGAIARLNCIDPERRSWRHGSIVWRQRYLRTLVGQPTDRLPIDRVVRRLKLASALIVLAAATLEACLQWI